MLTNVVTYGFIYEETKLVELYNSVNLCISTTRTENLSQFLTQACACGLPIIAFNTGGNSDIVKDGKNGFLINNFDTSMIISKTLELQKNNELYNLMKINSLNISETWDSNLIAVQYEKIFKKYYNDQ